MILRGLTPRSLTVAGRVAVLGLAALVLPLAPGFARDEPKPAEAPRSANVVVDEVPKSFEFVFNVNDDKAPKDDDKDEEKDDDKSDKEKSKADAKKDAEPKKARAEARVRIERRTTEKDDAPKPSKEDEEALEKAQAELKEAQAALAKAARKMADAQRKVHGQQARTFYRVAPQVRVEGKDIIIRRDGIEAKEGDVFNVKPDTETISPDRKVQIYTRRLPGPGAPPVPPVPPMPPVATRVPLFRGEGDQDRRMKELEKKLDALMGEIKELKKSKEGASNDSSRRDRISPTS